MTPLRGRARRRLTTVLVGGVALLAALAASDVLPPGAAWWAAHPMTTTAVSTIVAFVAISLLVETWLKEREAAQLDRISTVAYRSLAQHVNDAGRALLAPLTGADLHMLGIPFAAADDASAARARLDRHGVPATSEQATGSWRGITAASHDGVLRTLCAEPAYVRELFRTAALGRRRLHDATAVWATVMLTSRSSADDLGRLRALTDALEMLQERCRLSGVVRTGVVDWSADPVWLDAVSQDFWAAVAAYERLRDDFAELAALPSDAIVHRRG